MNAASKQETTTWDGFLAFEKMSRDTIDVKKIYIDVAGDLIAGLMLSQIVFWHLPNKQGKTKLRVNKNGELWLAKSDSEWFDEIRLTPSQARRARNVLKEKGLVKTKVFRFKGFPTVHFQLKRAVFANAITHRLDAQDKSDLSCRTNAIDLERESLTETTCIELTENSATTTHAGLRRISTMNASDFVENFPLGAERL